MPFKGAVDYSLYLVTGRETLPPGAPVTTKDTKEDEQQQEQKPVSTVPKDRRFKLSRYVLSEDYSANLG